MGLCVGFSFKDCIQKIGILFLKIFEKTSLLKSKGGRVGGLHKTECSDLKSRFGQSEFALSNVGLNHKVFEMSKQLDELQDQLGTLHSLITHK